MRFCIFKLLSKKLRKKAALKVHSIAVHIKTFFRWLSISEHERSANAQCAMKSLPRMLWPAFVAILYLEAKGRG
jgi:hypothetical protein